MITVLYQDKTTLKGFIVRLNDEYDNVILNKTMYEVLI